MSEIDDFPQSSNPETLREATKKQAQVMRQTTRLADLTRAIRSILQQVREDNPTAHFENSLQQSNSDELRNEILDLRRQFEIDSKMKRLSAETILQGMAFLKLAIPFVEEKKRADRMQRELEGYRSTDKRDSLTPEQQTTLRNLVMELRKVLQNLTLFREQVMKLFTKYSQGRRKDMGEEAALRHSTEYYLQFVDTPQRAKIETQMKGKLGDMSQEKRIGALKVFIETLVKISPSVRDAEIGRQLEMARLYLHEDHPDDALQELTHALAYGEYAEIYQEMAECWRRKEDPVREIQCRKKAVECQPDAMEPLLQLAEAEERTGNARAALAHYEQVVRSNPHRISLLNHIACLAFDQGIWPSAVQWLTKVLQEKPQSKKTMVRLGIALVNANQPDRALPILKECKRLRIEDERIDLHLGIIYRQKGHFSDARGYFESALRQRPDDWGVRCQLAQSDYDNGEYEEVETRCRELWKEKPENAEVQVLLAKSLVRQGRIEESLDVCRPFLEREDAPADILLEFGQACLKVRRNEEAYQALVKLIEREPENALAREAMGLACIQCGHFEEAVRYMAPVAEA